MMKVLVAVDRSQCSITAIRAVAEQFRPGDVDVYLLHVIDPMTYVPLSEGAVHDSKRVEARHKVSTKQARDLISSGTKLLADAGFRVKTTIREGEPRATIIAYAKHIKAEMIVVGSHSRHGLRRLLLGSVAEYVVRHAPCTVEIARCVPSAA